MEDAGIKHLILNDFKSLCTIAEGKLFTNSEMRNMETVSKSERCNVKDNYLKKIVQLTPEAYLTNFVKKNLDYIN